MLDIRRIREKMHEKPKNPKFIKTVASEVTKAGAMVINIS